MKPENPSSVWETVGVDGYRGVAGHRAGGRLGHEGGSVMESGSHRRRWGREVWKRGLRLHDGQDWE